MVKDFIIGSLLLLLLSGLLIAALNTPSPARDAVVSTPAQSQATQPEPVATSDPVPERKPESASPETSARDTGRQQAPSKPNAPTPAVQELVQPSDKGAVIGGYRLVIRPENNAGYDRTTYGGHNSDICDGKVGTSDPFTETAIDKCNVDHVVALQEAHQSGGHAWGAGMRKRFSQYKQNHLAIRACVNQSKGGRDIAEWPAVKTANTSACGGGYTLTAKGRCEMVTITLRVKAEFKLSVDAAEHSELKRLYGLCDSPAASQPAETSTPQPQLQPEKRGSCTHWHAGNPKHTHPGTNHDGTHVSDKCKGF